MQLPYFHNFENYLQQRFDQFWMICLSVNKMITVASKQSCKQKMVLTLIKLMSVLYMWAPLGIKKQLPGLKSWKKKSSWSCKDKAGIKQKAELALFTCIIAGFQRVKLKYGFAQ